MFASVSLGIGIIQIKIFSFVQEAYLHQQKKTVFVSFNSLNLFVFIVRSVVERNNFRINWLVDFFFSTVNKKQVDWNYLWWWRTKEWEYTTRWAQIFSLISRQRFQFYSFDISQCWRCYMNEYLSGSVSKSIQLDLLGFIEFVHRCLLGYRKKFSLDVELSISETRLSTNLHFVTAKSLNNESGCTPSKHNRVLQLRFTWRQSWGTIASNNKRFFLVNDWSCIKTWWSPTNMVAMCENFQFQIWFWHNCYLQKSVKIYFLNLLFHDDFVNFKISAHSGSV